MRKWFFTVDVDCFLADGRIQPLTLDMISAWGSDEDEAVDNLRKGEAYDQVEEAASKSALLHGDLDEVKLRSATMTSYTVPRGERP